MSGEAKNLKPVETRLDVKKFSDDDQQAWVQVGSKGGEYNKEDNLEGIMLDSLADELPLWDILRWLGASIGFAFVFLALLLTAFPNAVADNNFSELVHWLGLAGFISAFTGSESVGALATALRVLLLVVGGGALGGVTLNALFERGGQRARVDRLREITKGAKQIYPGSGQLIFTCGSKGIRVTNALRTLTWEVGWTAVAPLQELFRKRDEFPLANRPSAIWPF